MASRVEAASGHHGTPTDPDILRTPGLTTGQISKILPRLNSTFRNEVYPSLKDDIARQVDNDWGLLQCLLNAEAISGSGSIKGEYRIICQKMRRKLFIIPGYRSLHKSFVTNLGLVRRDEERVQAKP